MRRLIDALRVVRGNAKDLAIPEADSRAFAYLARRMHYESAAAVEQAIAVRMDFGRTLWDRFDELARGSSRGGPEAQ
jgi:[glutamine synthetase] adenylyltransferase / [glutamine synthetase]-adenylyl-L-tyrosine phosphorylase